MARKAGRPPKGHVFYEGDRWKVRVTCNNGERGTLKLDPLFPPHDPLARGAKDDAAKCVCKGCSQARAQGVEFARDARATGWTPPKGESKQLAPEPTVTQWAEKWTAHRERKGLSSATRCLGCYEKWVAPIIGTKAMRRVTRRDVELVVQHLDAAVVDGELSWKTAVNHWGIVTKMFADACRSKILELRVREDNPARDVEGPDRGGERSGPYLSPAEAVKLLSCERVPRGRRQIYALAMYSYMRRGELAVLTWADVNLDDGYMLVHRAENYDTREIKSTKAANVRRVPIEATLRPMLAALVGDDAARVLPIPSDLAATLRDDLRAAEVNRAELFADDATRRPLDFHDLRHTGITWRAIRGDDPMKIMRAAGHTNLATTMIYINEAQSFDAGFGSVFPPLPVALNSAVDSAGFRGKAERFSVARVGFEQPAKRGIGRVSRAILNATTSEVERIPHEVSTTSDTRQNPPAELLERRRALEAQLAQLDVELRAEGVVPIGSASAKTR